jgi:hypothetical protein
MRIMLKNTYNMIKKSKVKDNILIYLYSLAYIVMFDCVVLIFIIVLPDSARNELLNFNNLLGFTLSRLIWSLIFVLESNYKWFYGVLIYLLFLFFAYDSSYFVYSDFFYVSSGTLNLSPLLIRESSVMNVYVVLMISFSELTIYSFYFKNFILRKISSSSTSPASPSL